MDKAKILIVDDEAIIAEDMETAIINIGYEVVGRASNTKDAINKAFELKPDLILMDIVLKGRMNGIDASYEIHKKMDIPIIFLTAYSDIDLINKAKNIGPYAYLIKPFQERQLLASIEMAFFKKHMEEALRESETQKQALLDSSPDMILLLDLDMNIQWANKTALNMNPDAVEQTCFKAYIGRDKPCDGCPCRNAIDTGQTKMGVKYQHAIAGIKGESYWENIGVPIKDSNGKVDKIINIARNITERKRAEEALKESEEFSSSLLINSPNPIIVINPDSFIRYVNPALEKCTGFSSAELIGRKAPYPWWTEDTMHKITMNLGGEMRKRVTVFTETFKNKTNKKFTVEITSTPVKSIGRIKYYLENWVDITKT